MKISTVTPVFNKAEYLKPSLLSLLAQVDTTYDLEHIIVDDKSTDNSMDIINEFSSDHRIKIFNFQNHKGMAHARDFGIKQSAGDLIILHDSDLIFERSIDNAWIVLNRRSLCSKNRW